MRHTKARNDDEPRRDYPVRYTLEEKATVIEQAKQYGYKKYLTYVREVSVDPIKFLSATSTLQSPVKAESEIQWKKLGKNRLMTYLKAIVESKDFATGNILYYKKDGEIVLKGKDFTITLKT